MRILVVVADFPAISETFVLDQITGLIDRGFTVDILAARARPEPMIHNDVASYRLIDRTQYAPWDGDRRYSRPRLVSVLLSQLAAGKFGLVTELVRCGVTRKRGKAHCVEPRQILAFAHSLAKLPAPDVVLCHFGPQGDLMIRVRKALGACWPVATVFHGYDVSMLIKNMGPLLYDRLFREGDIFFPISDFLRLRLVQLGAAEAKTKVHRMCVRSSLFAEKTRLLPAGRVRAFTFVLIGRLIEKKGHDVAIRAIELCRQRDPDADIKLVIIGDGPLNSRLHQIVRELAIEELVEFRGSLARDDVQGALLAADGFVLPSVTADDGDMEGIPVVISEAMSAGLPVITTRHAGIPEVVVDGVTGILVAERDVEGLADALSRVASDPKLAYRLGVAGRSRIAEKFDLDHWNDLLAERLRAVASAVHA